MQKVFTLLLNVFLIAGCTGKQRVDLVVHNAKVYTVDSVFSVQESFAVKNGVFVAVGDNEEILSTYAGKEEIDGRNMSIYPGFYDSHGHLFGLANLLDQVDLNGTKSVSEVIVRLQEYEKAYPEREWIIGGGWDQNLWEVKEFPVKDSLDHYFPDKPVYLSRTDYHAAWVNSKAMEAVDLDPIPKIEGGKIIIDEEKQPSGIFIDNAMDLIARQIPLPKEAAALEMLQRAQDSLFSSGLTSIVDAGIGETERKLFKKLYAEDSLQIRLYGMMSVNPSNVSDVVKIKPFNSGNMSVRSVKILADGALGSRGAALLDRYSDEEGTKGFLLHSPEGLETMIKKLAKTGLQINTHAIGDSANRIILDLYGKYIEPEEDRRWRIEHAQIVNPMDLDKFKAFQIIPSIQPTHATSDNEWAKRRLGERRIRYAYAYKDLLDQYGLVALGTDFPVENYDPIRTFYAAVFRAEISESSEMGFQMENALSREEALKGMTIWSAYACFQENDRGSIEVGKDADFIMLDQDLMEASKEQISQAQVLRTVLAGKTVFRR